MNQGKTDLLICGGTLAGCYLALRAAEMGKRVVLSEMREFLGVDLVATARFCLAKDDPMLPLARALDLPMTERDGLFLLSEGEVRLSLAQRLEAAGVTVLYLSSPVAARRERGRIVSVTLATKYGAYDLDAASVADATETGLLSLLLRGRAPVYTDTATVRMAVFCDRVANDTPRTLIERDGIVLALSPTAVQGGKVQLSLTFCMDGLSDPVTRRARASARAYALAPRLLRELKESDPDFADVFLIGFAYEAELRPSRVAVAVEEGLTVIPPFAGVIELDRLASAPIPSDTYSSFGKPYEDDALPVRLTEAPLPAPTASLFADVGVGGLGTGGVAAAIALSEDPALRVVALDAKPLPGGTHTVGKVAGYWHGYRDGFCRVNDGERDAFLKEQYGELGITRGIGEALFHLETLLARGCTVLSGCLLFAPLMEGRTCRGFLAATEWGVLAVHADYTVDGTGDGDLAAGAGVPYTFGSLRDGMTQSYSMWGDHAEPVESFQYNHFHGDYDVIRPDLYSDYLRGILLAMLDNSPYRISPMLTVRESRHMEGEYRLTLRDILSDKLFPDTLVVGSCPFDSHGYNDTELEPCGMLNSVKPGHHLDNNAPPRVLPPMRTTARSRSAFRTDASCQRAYPVWRSSANACRRIGMPPILCA